MTKHGSRATKLSTDILTKRRDPTVPNELTVLFVAAVGGLGGPVKRLATLLANTHGIHRVLIKPRSDLLDRRIYEFGLAEEYIPMRRSAQRSYLGAFLLAARVLARASRRDRPIDVIHANGIVEFALCWPAALLLGKPIVSWVGNYEAPALVKRFNRLLRTVSSQTLWNAVSATAAAVVVDCGLADQRGVRVVTNIIDPADVAPTRDIRVPSESRRINIGYLQVAQWVKGFDLLPKVIDELSDVHDRVRFLVYTKRDGRPGWKELSAFSSNLVEVRPRTARVGDIYAECDIIFSPSRRESFNRVVAEALMTGTPVVASDLDAVRDVVGDAGLLFPVDNVSAAADCLRRLINDADLFSALSVAGKSRAQAWLPGPVVEDFMAQYLSLARDR